MSKITIPLSQAIPGMTVAEAIHDIGSGIIYVDRDVKLTDEMILYLESIPVNKIKVHVNTWEDIWKISEETKKDYEVCLEGAKDLLTQIEENSLLDVALIHQIKDNFSKHFNENHKIIGCVNLFKDINQYIYTHSINVALLCRTIGKWMNYDEQMIEALMIAGLLHDIGNIKVDSSILDKPGKLTDSEFEEIKKHTLYSYQLLQNNKNIGLDIKIGILMHHERLDGSGYPYGVYDENINQIARVVAIADVYDAMLSERVYHKKHNPFAVMQMVQENAFGKLDPEILFTFLSHVANYYIGTYITLNTGEVAKVVSINSRCIYRPIVQVGNTYIDLSMDYSRQIVSTPEE